MAAESAEDLFDGTEIDEMLSLRILTLSEAEEPHPAETAGLPGLHSPDPGRSCAWAGPLRPSCCRDARPGTNPVHAGVRKRRECR
ncbi:hypothetical protein [Thiohalorhabdus methylotrophus]|uniref:Uncharacterized protein n=1 Tax=Thiohalorhabdus methylotrophus TaxID=3242694 RepID=A0ABV4TUJ0_9GAMM